MIARLGLETLHLARVAEPGYPREGRGTGIVHLGCGAFFRAHLAAYTDKAIAASGGDWMIDGVGMRSAKVAGALNPQDGLYTLIESGPGAPSAHIIASLARVLVAAENPEAVLATMQSEGTRIVSLTVTEKGYCLNDEMDALNAAHPLVAADLRNMKAPKSVPGLIAEALDRRRRNGVQPFTVLCCDNLPENGSLARRSVSGFAQLHNPELADWILGNVAFPATMVDRITPAPTGQTLADAERLIGLEDLGAVETEPFAQWVIEDRFRLGRPDWDKAGALFVEDVGPFEAMKLRMLNGAHSMLAYSGFVAGRVHVRDVMADRNHQRLVRRHLAAASRTLGPVEGIDVDTYADQLVERFSNPAIAHETRQIAADGTQKLPQRVITPALETLRAGGDMAPFAFAVAAWMRYCFGRTDDGAHFDVNDPRQEEIAFAVAGENTPTSLCSHLSRLPGLFPADLSGDADWNRAVATRLNIMLTQGMGAAIEAEAGTCP